MNPEHAKILFDAMDDERKWRVTRRFDLIRLTPGATVHGAFVEAVDDEATNFEREMLSAQPAEGIA
jgi:hypothetical protein